jgi:hypothetical protein
MAGAMTLTRRDALMAVLKKVCLDPIMDKSYAEAEARLRKNPKFIEYEKILEKFNKIRDKLKKAEDKADRELADIVWFFNENDLSTPYVNVNLNSGPKEIEIKREDRAVYIELSSRNYKNERITEPVDMSSAPALTVVNDAFDLAELCTKELELIDLIRETREKIAELKAASKSKPKKKPKSKKQ